MTFTSPELIQDFQRNYDLRIKPYLKPLTAETLPSLSVMEFIVKPLMSGI